MERAVSTPGLLADIEARLGPIRSGEVTDEWRERAAGIVFEKYKPALLLLHFVEADEHQHEWGPDSPQGTAALEKIDRLIHELKETVERTAGDDSVAWIVISDHGFQRYDRSFHPRIVLRNLDYLTYGPGRQVQSYRVYPRSLGGMVALVAADPKDREAIDRTTRYFEFLAADPANGIHKLYGRDDLRQLGAFPDAFLAFDMAAGFAAGEGVEGPLVTQSGSHGAHGFDPHNPNLYASFIVSGTGVAPCKSMQGASLLDVAPTAAALLGVHFPVTAGHDYRTAQSSQ